MGKHCQAAAAPLGRRQTLAAGGGRRMTGRTRLDRVPQRTRISRRYLSKPINQEEMLGLVKKLTA